VILKQAEAKGRAVEAQEEMRQMLRVFIERLSVMTDSTECLWRADGGKRGLIEQATQPGRAHAGAQAGGVCHTQHGATVAQRAQRVARHART
jgi:hypothetical protein